MSEPPWRNTALVTFGSGEPPGLTVPTIDFDVVPSRAGEEVRSARQVGSWIPDPDAAYVWVPGR